MPNKKCIDCGVWIVDTYGLKERCGDCHRNFRTGNSTGYKAVKKLPSSVQQVLGYIRKHLVSPTHKQIMELCSYYGADISLVDLELAKFVNKNIPLSKKEYWYIR